MCEPFDIFWKFQTITKCDKHAHQFAFGRSVGWLVGIWFSSRGVQVSQLNPVINPFNRMLRVCARTEHILSRVSPKLYLFGVYKREHIHAMFKYTRNDLSLLSRVVYVWIMNWRLLKRVLLAFPLYTSIPTCDAINFVTITYTNTDAHNFCRRLKISIK